MSERKVLNKYFPPDFDPSKLKRQKKTVKDTQMTVRLMAPFSMRCTRCGEYIYKGKKFNARKETAVGDEYMGIKVFRFYIKCPVCSSEITFKTDLQNADFKMEHGATRNFENWKENDPNGNAGLMPGAEEDEEYDSEGNDRATRDAMADLERSQEASRREMEVMDELADLRSRNARVETNRAADDPESLLAALHAEREGKEQEKRRKAEEAEDDAAVAKYFTKMAPPKRPAGAKVVAQGADDAGDGDSDNSDDDEGSGSGAGLLTPAMTIKRRAADGAGAPSVTAILAAKGKAAGPAPTPAASTQQVKRKREGMQKLLGIKKKAKA